MAEDVIETGVDNGGSTETPASVNSTVPPLAPLTEVRAIKDQHNYKAPEGIILVPFETALAEFIEHTTKSANSCRLASELALVHFFNTGDLSQVQKLFDAMPKGYVRRQALAQWAGKYLPVIKTKGRFFKDKENGAKEMTEDNLMKALAEPFWESVPDPEDIDIDVQKAQKKVLSAITTMHGDRYKGDVRTTAYLNRLTAAVNGVPLA